MAVSLFGAILVSGCSSPPPVDATDGRNIYPKDSRLDDTLVNVGEFSKAAEGSGFPAHYLAPYLEVYKSPSAMAAMRKAVGVKYFNLAFVIDGGHCNAKFNGDTSISDGEWMSAISANRSAGGDVIASFGGSAGTELGLACKSVGELKSQYKSVIDTLHLSRIDLDIEGATIGNTGANDRRNKALAQLQKEYQSKGKKLDVSYTLPVSPSGLNGDGLKLLQNAKSNGLDVNLVNIMTMDYGQGKPMDMDMGTAAIKAATALHGQLHGIWGGKSDAELWSMEGNTPMIGINDDRSEVFSLSNARTLTEFARSKGIRQLSYWSAGRDQECKGGMKDSSDCSGVKQSMWQFAGIANGVTKASAPASPAPSKSPTSGPTHESKPPSSSPSSRPTSHQSAPATHMPTSFHTTGQVHCESGRSVVGIWVETQKSGDSRFAAWKALGDGSTADWWTDLPSDERYSLHVGCGGTPEKWAGENRTGIYSGPHNSFDCYDMTGDPRRGTCTHR
ncbi:chitinase [Streptomyces sp. Lzd4kr]|nr:chitinase [Streptomyces sp. Lzd4kr]